MTSFPISLRVDSRQKKEISKNAKLLNMNSSEYLLFLHEKIGCSFCEQIKQNHIEEGFLDPVAIEKLKIAGKDVLKKLLEENN